MICNLLCTFHAWQSNSIIVDNDTDYYAIFKIDISVDNSLVMQCRFGEYVL